MNNPWVYRPKPNGRAVARLFCFHHAGVGGAVYRLWPNGLPDKLEVCAVQLPGRGGRLREPLLSSISAIVDALLPALLPLLDRPFAVFGHSMGAVIGSEFVRALLDRGGPLPEHLVVSGRRPAHVPDSQPLLNVLDDAAFVAEVNLRYGGIPSEVLADAEVMALLLPALRADITALETFHPGRRAPLPCPISAFGGHHDHLTPRAHLEAWRDETLASCRVRVFPGDHFYLEAQRSLVLAELSATLGPMLGDATTEEAA
jgi:surfactin synthase thioesterase subunit